MIVSFSSEHIFHLVIVCVNESLLNNAFLSHQALIFLRARWHLFTIISQGLLTVLAELSNPCTQTYAHACSELLQHSL